MGCCADLFRCSSLSLLLISALFYTLLGAGIVTLGVLALTLPWAKIIVPDWYAGVTIGVGALILFVALFGYLAFCRKKNKCSISIYMLFCLLLCCTTVASTVVLFRYSDALHLAKESKFVNVTDWQREASESLKEGVEEIWEECGASVYNSDSVTYTDEFQVDADTPPYELRCTNSDFDDVAESINDQCLEAAFNDENFDEDNTGLRHTSDTSFLAALPHHYLHLPPHCSRHRRYRDTSTDTFADTSAGPLTRPLTRPADFLECYTSSSWWAPEARSSTLGKLNTPKGVFCACYEEFADFVDAYFFVGKWVSFGFAVFFGLAAPDARYGPPDSNPRSQLYSASFGCVHCIHSPRVHDVGSPSLAAATSAAAPSRRRRHAPRSRSTRSSRTHSMGSSRRRSRRAPPSSARERSHGCAALRSSPATAQCHARLAGRAAAVPHA